MGFLCGPLFFLASSLVVPARMKIKAKSQILAHLIFRVRISTWGIRLLLRLVITPPTTITMGKIHGVLNRKKVARVAPARMQWVMVLCTETLKAFQEA